ncbi:DUF6249 domain-containing protein [Gemmatimonadota bacterium]
MSEFIGLIAVVLIFGTIPAVVIYIVRSRHNERMQLIERGEYSSFSRLDVQSPPHPGRYALLFSLIFIGLGLAGIIYFMVMGIDDGFPFYASLVFLVVGGAILLYYRLLAPLREKASQAYDTQLAMMQANGKAALPATKDTE